ncbi:hypothetical protein GCM10011344_42100 [Dokdonia pacifica]|uniref:Uncharacterized protein n=1 Tax=Dokdonia pacifica TaxID=1627892 RepID=A0A239DKM6_9FLAO|nr:hypothetical protein [Dokdonia pacifica]GGG36847.1 hypothetical protein GCM10011344_42100 [Dokdonia pacifica]SNS32759.1 hypothetical protein SAMN06265376_11159 [Dokdonia pacifica]
MLKNISNLGNTLSQEQLKETLGGMQGFGKVICVAPYLIAAGETCAQGYHPHPTMGHCVCCRD